MKIMIVEDHPKIREELSALLRRYGYETVHRDNGYGI